MHLKSYPKLVRSELRLDPASVQTSSQRSSTFINQQGELLRTCSSTHGNISSSRLPLSVISNNMLRCSNATTPNKNNNINSSSVITSLQLKTSPSGALQLHPSPPGCENDTLSLYQTAAEDSDAPLDIWAVIKPGHVREKIAIFASEAGRTDAAGGSERTSTSGSGSWDHTSLVCTSHSPTAGLSRAVKAKGSWEETCNAKRRRRSGSNQNLQQDQRTRLPDTTERGHKLSPLHQDLTQQVGGEQGGIEAVTEEAGDVKVSVVDMVAFLEQRASEQQPDSKPLLTLQRSSTTIMLSRALPPEVREGSEVSGEESECVRVSDMVAKLESECLRRRAEGDLSRSNSLRRTVGRVLLAARDQCSTPCQPTSPSSLPRCQREPISCSETPKTESSTLTPPPPLLATPLSCDMARGAVSTASETRTMPMQSEGVEPLPGLLFLSPSPAASEPQIHLHTDSAPLASPHTPTDYKPRPQHHRTFDLETVSSQPCPPPVSRSQSEEKKWRAQEEEVAIVPVARRVSVSQDFLEMRQRLQQLLEPQPYLSLLPHHLLLKILMLLNTQSLAALKCSCQYFRFIIETYGVRPADSLWVSDPRYRDDPCKQCKKRYGRGDVSLCRWHHKPYCQALPYGPGYWMCCHGAHRDAPGCNVGLHDNNWVPAFHSINVPIYRRSRNAEDD
ncbi:hypothetical protein PAMP_006304 [Pampus punctatissimus]